MRQGRINQRRKVGRGWAVVCAVGWLLAAACSGSDEPLGNDAAADQNARDASPAADRTSPDTVGDRPDADVGGAVPEASADGFADGSTDPPSNDAQLDSTGPLVCGCQNGLKACAKAVAISGGWIPRGVCLSPTPEFGCSSGICRCEFPQATPKCENGACAIGTCNAGWDNCNNNPTDGCERNITTPSDCGACNQACSPGQKCGPTGCMATCPPPLADCNGSCVDLAFSTVHCGMCNQGCLPAKVCSSGTCVDGPCPSGFTRCGGACVDFLIDPVNCGACGHLCSSSWGAPSCQAGQCSTCSNGQIDCNGLCSDTSADPDNCGGCGQPCAPPNVCQSGQCLPLSTLLLATGLSKVPTLAFDDQFVYWIDVSDGTISRVAKTGGAKQLLTTDNRQPTRFALDATSLYYTQSLGSIMSLPKAGGTPTPLTSATNPSGIAVDDTGVYFANQGDSTLRRVDKAGGTSVEVTTLVGLVDPRIQLTDVALDGTSVYVTAIFNHGYLGIDFVSAPKMGGAAQIKVFGTDHTGPGDYNGTYALDGTNVYTTDWQRGPGGITRLRVAQLSGPATLPLLAAGWYGLGTRISFDADYLYFAHTELVGGNSGVFRMPKCGGPEQQRIRLSNFATVVAVDTSDMYLVVGSQLLKARK
jgi:hypothetical protein